MDISAIFKAELTPDKDRSAENLAALRMGDKLIGKVLGLEPDGRALIDLGRFKALARTTLPVEVGQKLPLKVVQTGTPTHLRLDLEALQPSKYIPRMAVSSLFGGETQEQVLKAIDRFLSLPEASQSQAGKGIQNFPGHASLAADKTLDGSGRFNIENIFANRHLPEAVRQAISQLRSAFDTMPFEASTSEQARWVRSVVEDRGILFELKLADVLLKSSGQELSGRGGNPPAGAGQENIPDGVPGKKSNTTSGIKAGEISRSAGPLENPVATGSSREPASQVRGASVSGQPGQTTTHTADQQAILRPGQGSSTMPHQQPQGDSALEKAVDVIKALGFGKEPEANHQSVVLSRSPDAPDPSVLESIRHVLARDLKPQLLILKSFLSDADGHPAVRNAGQDRDVTMLRQVVDQLLSHVEQQQGHAVRRSAEPDLYQVFTHLLPVKGQEAPVQLKVYYPKKGSPGDDDGQHRIALLLDMDRLGPVRVDLKMTNRQLQIHFFVRNDVVKQMFDAHTNDISDALHGHFEQVNIQSSVSVRKIEQFEGEDLAGPPLGRIDIKA